MSKRRFVSKNRCTSSRLDRDNFLLTIYETTDTEHDMTMNMNDIHERRASKNTISRREQYVVGVSYWSVEKVDVVENQDFTWCGRKLWNECISHIAKRQRELWSGFGHVRYVVLFDRQQKIVRWRYHCFGGDFCDVEVDTVTNCAFMIRREICKRQDVFKYLMTRQ